QHPPSPLQQTSLPPPRSLPLAQPRGRRPYSFFQASRRSRTSRNISGLLHFLFDEFTCRGFKVIAVLCRTSGLFTLRFHTFQCRFDIALERLCFLLMVMENVHQFPLQAIESRTLTVEGRAHV